MGKIKLWRVPKFQEKLSKNQQINKKKKKKQKTVKKPDVWSLK